MGGACALHRFHGTEHPHIRSTLGPAHSGAKWARDVQGGLARVIYPQAGQEVVLLDYNSQQSGHAQW